MLAAVCDGRPEAWAPAKKTPLYVLRNVILARKDKDGRLVTKPKHRRPGLSDEEEFTLVYVRRGVRRWRIKEMWKERLREAGGVKR